MTDQPAHRQLWALSFCAFTVPAVLLLPRVGWLWAGLASLVCALVLLALFRLSASGETGIPQVASKSILGRYLLVASFLWNLLMLGAASRQLCAAYPGGGILIGGILLLLASWGSSKGAATVSRVGGITFFFLLIIYSIVLIFAIPGVKPNWLAPVREVEWIRLPAVLCPALVFYLTGRGRPSSGRPWLWLAGGVLLVLASGAICAGRLSPEVTGADPFPFYTMTQGISLLGVMERFEPLVSAAVSAGGFCLLSLLCLANQTMVEKLRPTAKKLVPPVNFFAGFGAIWLSGLLSGGFLAVGTAIFWGLFPLLLLSLANRKKVEKN